LKKIHADIIVLQEVDIGCKRTNFMNVGLEIAYALKYQILFGAEAWHVNEYDENKNYKTNIKWNDQPFNGCEGNAILTRFNINYAYSLVLPCVRTKSMPYHAHMKRHTVPIAIIDVPDIGEVACYSIHLDAHCGRHARAYVQYRVLYEDAMKYHSNSLKSHHRLTNTENKNNEWDHSITILEQYLFTQYI